MNALVQCFSPQCLAAHADDPAWAEKVIEHLKRHRSLPTQYMVQVLKDYGLICRTSTWRDCRFVDLVRRELSRTPNAALTGAESVPSNGVVGGKVER